MPTWLKEPIAELVSQRQHRLVDLPESDLRSILWLLADILDELRQIRRLLEENNGEEDEDT